MTGAGDVDPVQVIGPDRPVQVDVDEILARRRAPMADDQGFHMIER
jgi:hypothetical protein